MVEALNRLIIFISSSNISDDDKRDMMNVINALTNNQRLGYNAKATLVLEDSCTQTSGLVRDYEGSFIWKKGEGPIVGEWTKSPQDNNYHIFLTTHIAALTDKAISQYEHFVKMREQGQIKAALVKAEHKKPKRVSAHIPTPTSVSVSSSVPAPSEILAFLDSQKAKLSSLKQLMDNANVKED